MKVALFILKSNFKIISMSRVLMLLVVAIAVCLELNAQEVQQSDHDTIKGLKLEEIIVVGQRPSELKNPKPVASLDQYLEKSVNINMIRRGAYAWEPFLNGMSSERGLVTIDGMRIYAACTDKMDPVTSYVEISNLSRVSIHDGVNSSGGGATLAGTMNLERKKSSFRSNTMSARAFAGFETNNKQKIVGAGFSKSKSKVFSDFDVSYRQAADYKSGGGQLVKYSGFTKYNASMVAGYKLTEHQDLEASLIYDRAVNVGYPALPMDVSLAEALISSVAYTRHHISSSINKWESKVYFNKVTHVMDDSQRPDVPVRMDMPGWSNTLGFYSKLTGRKGFHDWSANLSGHQNTSLAEMTMYANAAGQRDMFMLTWPGVRTTYGDIYLEDRLQLRSGLTSSLSAGIAVHDNRITELLGLESLRIFYPSLTNNTTRVLTRLAANTNYKNDNWDYLIGLSYGQRAPSISEGYGYYLFNSFDRFDYIGNPVMKNETSSSVNAALSYEHNGLSVRLSGSFYHISHYIIGRPAPEFSAMTIGAEGVKVYEQLRYANIVNNGIEIKYSSESGISYEGNMSYRRGWGAGAINLPLIQPLSYNSVLTYSRRSFAFNLTWTGAFNQRRFNQEFGERALAAYQLFGLAVTKRVKLSRHSIILKSGVENIFDRLYTTFADWNRVPRMGRNFYINILWDF